MSSLNYASAADANSLREMEKFTVERVAGQGTFGTVQLCKDRATGAPVAIKKVIQDPRFRNRELQIMQDLSVFHHPNIIQLLSYFYTRGAPQRNDIYLNVVMEFVPETLHRCFRGHYRRPEGPPQILIKVFMYQLLRSIAFLHLSTVNVCHRDIKPHNILVNESTGRLKLCDFGSAKKLSPSEPNVAYICSRYYRAPELIFGNQHYTTAVDIWSVGCIFGEMMLGEPIFRGDNSNDQFYEIAKLLGYPTVDEMKVINRNGVPVALPNRARLPWNEVFKHEHPPEAYDLLTNLLQYVPENRLSSFDALCHPYFDELHDPSTKLPSNGDLPADLFEFLPCELEAMTSRQKVKLQCGTK